MRLPPTTVFSRLSLLILVPLLLAGCGSGGEEAPTAARDGAPAQSTARGGEASIEAFGTEAAGSERKAIRAPFEDYLDALASRDYVTACSYLSAALRRSLKRFLAAGSRGADCAALLARLLAPTAAALAREQGDGKITKVRAEGGRAFLIFRAPGAELYQMPMTREAGRWKVSLLSAAVLVPSL